MRWHESDIRQLQISNLVFCILRIIRLLIQRLCLSCHYMKIKKKHSPDRNISSVFVCPRGCDFFCCSALSSLSHHKKDISHFKTCNVFHFTHLDMQMKILMGYNCEGILGDLMTIFRFCDLPGEKSVFNPHAGLCSRP